MKEKKFREDYENSLSDLVSRIEQNNQENNIDFVETANEIFDFLSKAHFGELKNDDKIKLKIDSSDIIRNQLNRLNKRK